MTSVAHKHFSMIRDFQVADWFTLGNAVCGTAALFSITTFVKSGALVHVYLAGGLVLAALLCDLLDGRIARWRHGASPLGLQLDSLADVISFGVTPAMIGYGCGMQGLYDRLILGYFVACGVSRLARYNVSAPALSAATGKVTHFEGTPIPTSCDGRLDPHLWFGEISLAGAVLHPLTLMFALSGSLMISRIRIPKL